MEVPCACMLASDTN